MYQTLQPKSKAGELWDRWSFQVFWSIFCIVIGMALMNGYATHRAVERTAWALASNVQAHNPDCVIPNKVVKEAIAVKK